MIEALNVQTQIASLNIESVFDCFIQKNCQNMRFQGQKTSCASPYRGCFSFNVLTRRLSLMVEALNVQTQIVSLNIESVLPNTVRNSRLSA